MHFEFGRIKKRCALPLSVDAEDASVIAGSDAGQWAFVLTFGDWEAFGKSMKSASSDPEFAQVLSGLDAAAELVSRRILVSVDL